KMPIPRSVSLQKLSCSRSAKVAIYQVDQFLNRLRGSSNVDRFSIRKSRSKRLKRLTFSQAIYLPHYPARQKSFELSCSHRMLQLADGLGFNLTHALARYLEDSAHFFERIGVTVTDAVAQLDDLALAVGQRLENLLDLVLEHFLRGAFDRIVSLLVFN